MGLISDKNQRWAQLLYWAPSPKMRQRTTRHHIQIATNEPTTFFRQVDA